MEGRPAGSWGREYKLGRGWGRQGLHHIGLVGKVRNLVFYSMSDVVDFKQRSEPM